jgi:predicted Ser/Thr protein kinase
MLGLGFEKSAAAGQGRPTASQSGGGRFTPPSPDELAPWFPQLEILELLGHGGMGAVYKARQTGLDRLVALKILPAEFGRDENFMQRFSREAKALARLDHPNIVTVHDFGRAGDLCFFVMEFIDGVNLRQLRQTGALDPKTALALVPQICEALQYAHDEGVVHRDIKPENILVDKRGRVKIADFGLAKLLGAHAEHTLTGSHQAMGTFHYMAPEQLAGAAAVDHRADIYSLGVVFYELLTGNLPVGRFAPPSKKVHIDVRLDEVVLRALEAEPERRYQQASEVKSDVESICGLSFAGRELPPHLRRAFGYEYRSKTMILGWPLVHIATGVNPATMKKRVAKGWIAIGDVAIGGLAMGGCAVGVFAIGGCAIGAFTLGGLSLGLLVAFGGMAIGALAMGGGALGLVAIGGGAVGVYAYGGGAFGVHALGGNVRDPAAEQFFAEWGNSAFRWFTLVSIVTPFLMVFVAAAIFVSIWIQRRREHVPASETYPIKSPPSPQPTVGQRAVWLILFVLSAIVLLFFVAVGTYFFAARTRVRHAREAEMAAQVAERASQFEIQQRLSRSDLVWRTGWQLTPEGPALHDDEVRSLRLTEAQAQHVNAALRDVYQKARDIEARKEISETNDRGRRVTQIPASPSDVDALENEFWSKLDASLDPQQQRIARANLQVRAIDAAPGVSLHELVAPGLFGYLEAGARIETWRLGTWHHWNVTVRGFTTEQSAPEMPLLYRRYWDDPIEAPADSP